jgi:RNA polymerase sigma-70 factor, ECF subfamily
MIFLVFPDVTDDQVLLKQIHSKQDEALRVIYERYAEPIYQFVRLRINDREQVQDIVADVFLDFLVAVQRDNPPHTNLRGWLFQVARNKVIDHYGKEKKLPQTSLEDWMPDNKGLSPESRLLESIQIERIRRALGALVVEQQEVIILRFGQHLNLQETADVMDKSVSAIKSLQFRAVQNLRELIGVDEKE